MNQFFDGYLLALLLGAIVGASEIISRYRDEPFQVLRYRASIVYMALNGLVAVLAYALLDMYGNALFPDADSDAATDMPALFEYPLLKALAAGLGSSVILRSRFLSFKTDGGDEYSIGLDALVSVFLGALDRSVDRKRATRRQNLVFGAMNDIERPRKAIDLLKYSLHSFQNLSEEEREKILDQIEALTQKEADDRLRLAAVLFGFLNIGGESNFRNLIKHFKSQASEGDKDEGGKVDSVEEIEAKQPLG